MSLGITILHTGAPGLLSRLFLIHLPVHAHPGRQKAILSFPIHTWRPGVASAWPRPHSWEVNQQTEDFNFYFQK